MATTAHSDKGLLTLSLMGTTPTDWRLTPIEWYQGERLVWVEDTCPTCEGRRSVLFDSEGADRKPLPWPTEPRAIEEYRQKVRAAQTSRWANPGNCPSCLRKKGFATGKAKVQKMMEVWVARILWPKGTIFASRFRMNSGHRHCELCAKPVKFFTPVMAETPDGRVQGMLVGEDCGRKIFQLSVQKPDKDAVLEYDR